MLYCPECLCLCSSSTCKNHLEFCTSEVRDLICCLVSKNRIHRLNTLCLWLGFSCCSLTVSVFPPSCNIPSLAPTSAACPPPLYLPLTATLQPYPSIPALSEDSGDMKRITTTHQLNTPGLLHPIQDWVKSETDSITSGAKIASFCVLFEKHQVIDGISVNCWPWSKN